MNSNLSQVNELLTVDYCMGINFCGVLILVDFMGLIYKKFTNFYIHHVILPQNLNSQNCLGLKLQKIEPSKLATITVNN